MLARVGRGAKRHGSFANALKKPRIQPVHDDGLGQRLGRGPGRHFKQGLDTRLIADQLGPVAGKTRRAVAGEEVGICAVDLRTGFGEIVHKIEEALQKPLFPSRIEQNCSVRFFFTTSKNGVFLPSK